MKKLDFFSSNDVYCVTKPNLPCEKWLQGVISGQNMAIYVPNAQLLASIIAGITYVAIRDGLKAEITYMHGYFTFFMPDGGQMCAYLLDKQRRTFYAMHKSILFVDHTVSSEQIDSIRRCSDDFIAYVDRDVAQPDVLAELHRICGD